jgi:hypothetical protein
MGTDDTNDERNDDSTDSLKRFRPHREALERIGASSDPDAYVARIILARLDGRDPDPDDLNRLMGTDERLGEVGAPTLATPGERLRSAAARVLEKAERSEGDDGREAE